jgi:hypothetical protein
MAICLAYRLTAVRGDDGQITGWRQDPEPVEIGTECDSCGEPPEIPDPLGQQVPALVCAAGFTGCSQPDPNNSDVVYVFCCGGDCGAH